jgi:tetratricopeptide (TPR) repeat protein
MSAESVRKLLGGLLDDPESEAVWSQLEELAIGGELTNLGDEGRASLAVARSALAARGEAEAVAKLLDIEGLLAPSDADRIALARERARLLEEELLDDRSALGALEPVKSDPECAESAARIAAKKDGWKELVARFKKAAEETGDVRQIASHLASAAAVILQYKGKGRDRDADTLFQEALSVDPSNLRVIQLYERVLRRRGDRWDDLSAHLERGADAVVEGSAKVALLLRAARTHAGRRRDFTGAERCYRAALRVDPVNRDANRFLVHLLSAQDRQDDLAKLYEAQLALPGNAQDVGLLVQVGMTHWRARNDPRSAQPFFRALSAINPGHPLAKSFFDENPADALNAQDDDGPEVQEIEIDEPSPASLPPRAPAEPVSIPAVPSASAVPSIAQQSPVEAPVERKVDTAASPDAAPTAEGPAAPAAPAAPRVEAALKATPARAPEPPRATPSVGTALRSGTTPEQKLAMAIDVAQQFERSGQVDKAIDGWKAVLRLDASESTARDALHRLYTQAGRWNNLIELLRQELESLGGSKAIGDESTLGRRLDILREMADVYRDRMALEPMVVQTYTAILTLSPGDVPTLVALGRSYDKLGRHTDLIKVLEQQVELTEDSAEKTALLRRIATIWVERLNNVNNATRPLEQILTIAPGNVEAIAELKDLYTKRRAWRPLFEVLRKEAATLAGAARRDALVESAKLAAEKLNSPVDAIAVWREALALDPRTPGALDAVEKLTEREKDWAGLASVLEQRVAEATDDESRVNVLMKLGAVYSDRLEDVGKSIATWRRVLEVKRGHPKATRVLRDAYTAAGDWDALEAMYLETGDFEGLVEVFGGAADRVEDPATRIALSFRAAAIYEEQLGAPARAFRSYERVLTVEPKNPRAAAALVEIYRNDEKWPRLAQMYEVLLDATPTAEVDRSLDLLLKLRDLASAKLYDRPAAFRWALLAYRLRPEDSSLELSLERAAQEAGAYAALVEAFDARAASVTDEGEVARLRDKCAQLEADRLDALDAAITRYQVALARSPADTAVIEALDALLRRAARWSDLRGLFDHRLARETARGARRALLLAVAELEETSLGEADSAAARYRALLEDDAEDLDALEALCRLAERGRRWEELASLLARRAALSSGDERADLCHRLGKLQQAELQAPDRAIDSFVEALSLSAHHGPTLTALESLLRVDAQRSRAAAILDPEFEATEQWPKLAWVLQILLEAAADDAERKRLALRLSAVLSDRLSDADRGFELLRSILVQQPTDVELLDAADALAQRAGADEKLVHALGGLFEDGALAADTRVRIARRASAILDDRLGRPDDAERFHRAVIASGEQAHGSLERLRGLFQQRERYQDLRALYATWISRSDNDAERVELLVQDAQLADEVLSAPAAAIEQYQRILTIDPGHTAALSALERLLSAQARWTELDGVYSRWIEADAALAPSLRLRQARVRAHQLGEHARALDELEVIVADQPDHAEARGELEGLVREQASVRLRAAAVLERLYENEGDAANLVRMLRVRLEGTDAREERGALLRTIAELLESRLSDGVGAFEAMCEALVAEPASESHRADVARLAEIADRNVKAAEVLLRAAEDPAGEAARIELLREAAKVLDERLGDLARAERVHRRLLELSTDEEVRRESAESLERIYVALGNPAGLVEALLLRIELEPDGETRRELLARTGELQETELRDLSGAIRSHRGRLEIDPSDRAALDALIRLYEQSEQWRALVEALGAASELSQDGAEQKSLRLRAADVLVQRLGAREEAIRHYSETLETFGPDRGVHASIAVLYEAAERWTELLDVLSRDLEIATSDQDRLTLIVRSAELRRVRTGEPLVAIEGYRDALEIDRGDVTARKSLEVLLASDDVSVSLAAARVLAPVFEAEGRWEALVPVLDRIAERTDEEEERRASLARAAEVCDLELSAPARAFGYAARELRLVASDPDVGGRLATLERLAGAANLRAEQARTLREVAPDLTDVDLQLEAFVRIAELSRDALQEPSAARDYYEKALELRPDHGPALDALEALHESTGAHAALLDVLRRKAEFSQDDSLRRALLRKQAQVCEDKLSDRAAAASAYEALLGIAFDRAAAAELERIYALEERWSDLASLLESQLAQPERDEVSLYHRLGVVCAERLDEPERALEHFREALARRSDHPETVSALEKLGNREGFAARVAEMLEPVYLRREDWPRVVQAIETRIAVEDSENRRTLLARLGSLYEESMEDLDKGLDTYARMFREDVRDRDAWSVIERLSRLLNRLDRQAEIFASGLETVESDDETTAELALTTARLFDAHGNEPERARRYYLRVLAFDPHNVEAFVSLEALLRKQSAFRDLEALYREGADQAVDPARQRELLLKKADVEEASLGDHDAAIATFRRVLEVDPLDAVAIARLDALLTRTEAWSALAELTAQRVDDAVDSTERSALRIRLGALRATRLSDPAGAVDALEAVVLERPDHPQAVAALEQLANEHPPLRARIIEILEPLYRNLDDWSKLIVVLNARLAQATDQGDRSAILREIAAIRESRAGDPRGAFEACAAAFVADPNDQEARSTVDRLAASHRMWDEWIRTYEAAISGSDDVGVKVDLLRAVAETHDQHRDAPRDAIVAWERLFAADDTQVEALDQLQNLHVLLSDWVGLVSVLERKAEREMDDAVRTALLHEIGEYQFHMIGNGPAAIHAYRRALEANPSDTVALEALDDLYERSGDGEALAEILRQRLDIEVESEARVGLALRLGRLFDARLNDRAQAIDAFRRAVDDAPTNSEALLALERLYTAAGAHHELLENLRSQSHLATDQGTRNAILLRIGALQSGPVGDSAAALETYRDILGSDRTNAAALGAARALAEEPDLRADATALLEPLLRELQRWDELVSVLELKLGTLDDSLQRRDELRELARIHERSRSDGAAAFDALRRAAHEDPSHVDTLAQLERLAAQLDRWADVAALYEDESANASDPMVGRDLSVRAAVIARDRLRDDTRAIASFRQALSHGEDDDILSALEDIYASRKRWEEVAEVLERRVALTGDPLQLDPLEIRLAQVRLERFQRADSALAALRNVTERSPGNAAALGALERLVEDPSVRTDALDALESAYITLDDASKLAWIKRLRVKDATDPSDRVQLLMDLSRLREERLHDLPGALDAVIEAFTNDPSSEAALGEIERLAPAAGRWVDTRGVIERAVSAHEGLDDAMRATLYLRAARWYRDHLQDEVSAEARVTDALRCDPEYGEALALLELIHRGAGRERDLVVTLRRRAELELDGSEKKRLLREAAQIAEQTLGSTETAAEITQTLLELDDADVEALELLARLRLGQGRHGEVAELLSRLARLTDDPTAAAGLRRQVAEMYAGPIGDDSRAILAFREMLDLDPTDERARVALEGLLEKSGLHRELEEALRARVDNAVTSEERNETRVRLAKLVETRFGQADRAVDYLREVLDETPGHASAGTELERLYAAGQRWNDLSELLERRAQDAADVGDAQTELATLVRIGELLERTLGDRPRAVELYERVLEREPEHSLALAAVARLAEADAQWERAASMLDRALRLATPGSEGAEIGLRLAALRLDRLGDPAGGEQALRRALELDRSCRAALDRLKALATSRGDDRALADLLDHELSITTDSARKVALHKEAAGLHRDRLGDPDRAAQHFEQARALVPDDKDLLLSLVDVYLAAGRQRDAIPVIEAIIASFGTRRSKELATWFHRLGQAQEAIGETSTALTHFDSAFKIDLTNVPILRDLGLLCYKSGDMDRAQKTFRALLLQKLDASSGITKADVYYYLGDTLRQQNETQKAIGMLERAVEAEKGHPRATTLLAQLKGR